MCTNGLWKKSDYYCAKMTQFFLYNQQKTKALWTSIYIHYNFVFLDFILPFMTIPYKNPIKPYRWASSCCFGVFFKMYNRLFAQAVACQHIQDVWDWTALFPFQSQPRNKKQKGERKKKSKSRKSEERKISSWLLPTITNSSFPLRRHSHSWNHTL